MNVCCHLYCMRGIAGLPPLLPPTSRHNTLFTNHSSRIPQQYHTPTHANTSVIQMQMNFWNIYVHIRHIAHMMHCTPTFSKTWIEPKWSWNHIIYYYLSFCVYESIIFICHSHQHRSQMISPLIESAPWSVSAGQMWGASDCKYSIVNKIINKILRRINREMARYWSRVTW